MIYAIKMYSRKKTDEAYEYMGTLHLTCIPRESEYILFKDDVHMVESVFHIPSEYDIHELKIYCEITQPINTDKKLINGN